MNAQELVDYTRWIVSETSGVAAGRKVWSDTEILNYINQAYFALYRRQVQEDTGHGLVQLSIDTSLAKGVAPQHPTLGPTGGDTVEKLMYLPPWVWRVAEVWDSTDLPLSAAPRFSSEPNSWCQMGSSVLGVNLTGKAASATGTEFTIWCYRTPVELCLGTSTFTASTTELISDFLPNATLGTLDNSFEAYLGAWFQLTNTTAVPTYGWIGKCGADLTTEEATCKLALNGPSNPVAIAADQNFAMVPDMDFANHELIAYGAADRAFIKEGNLNGKRLLQTNIQMLESCFEESLMPRGMRHKFDHGMIQMQEQGQGQR